MVIFSGSVGTAGLNRTKGRRHIIDLWQGLADISTVVRRFFRFVKHAEGFSCIFCSCLCIFDHEKKASQLSSMKMSNTEFGLLLTFNPKHRMNHLNAFSVY